MKKNKPEKTPLRKEMSSPAEKSDKFYDKPLFRSNGF